MAVGAARAAILRRRSAGRQRQYRHRDRRGAWRTARAGCSISANAINASLYDNLNFNFIRDIAPVASISTIPLVMEVNPSVPAHTIPEFVAYAKANPGKIDVGVGRHRDPLHVAGELFKMMAGVDMIHVPYRSEALALPDLISGQGVQMMFGVMPASLGYIRAANCVLSRSRAQSVRNFPDAGVERVFPGYEANGWYGIGTPQSHIPHRNYRKA